MPLRISVVEFNFFNSLRMFNREAIERLQGYLPVVICLIRDASDRARFLLTSPTAQTKIWAPPQKTILPEESIEKTVQRCLEEELNVPSGFRVERHQYIAHRTLPEERQGERPVDGALLRYFAKHKMVGKAYWAAVVTMDSTIQFKPNISHLTDAAWLDFATLQDRLHTNEPGKLEVLKRTWQLLHPSSSVQLAAWLREGGVDTGHWGRDAAKTVDDLWQEIERDEVLLCRQPLKRCVRVACLEIHQQIDEKDQVLVEAWQELARGGTRRRGGIPAEKMRFAESALEAAARCLQEELEIVVAPQQLEAWRTAGNVRVSAQPRLKRGESWSYPKLPAEYGLYTVRIDTDKIGEFPALPTDQVFRTGEHNEAVVGHDWEWVDPAKAQELKIRESPKPDDV